VPKKVAKKIPAKKASKPRASNPPDETMGSSGGYQAKSFGVSPDAPEHSNPDAAKAESYGPGGFGSAGGPEELDVYPDHGNSEKLFNAGMPDQDKTVPGESEV
jgi:hypothetical protein